MAEVFVKGFKRDDVYVSRLGTAASVLAQLPGWMLDSNTDHPYRGLGMRAPRVPYPGFRGRGPMTRDDIFRAAREFLAIASAEMSPPERERLLRRALDQLALAYHFAEAPRDEREYPAVGERGHEAWKTLYERYSALFPDFGYYNTAEDVLEKLGTSSAITGDAIDDLSDITLDVQGFVDRWEQTSPEAALEHFRSSFEYHWGRHLRALQAYLHERAFYRPEL